jgi:hypothetical protein
MGKLKEIDEHQYKVDFEILNGYINFSSELLRLSLFGNGQFWCISFDPYKRRIGRYISCVS